MFIYILKQWDDIDGWYRSSEEGTHKTELEKEKEKEKEGWEIDQQR